MRVGMDSSEKVEVTSCAINFVMKLSLNDYQKGGHFTLSDVKPAVILSTPWPEWIHLHLHSSRK
jgi:hypothetical protein